jgi:cation:H+ antiporter
MANVIGSNTTNVTLVFGSAALFAPVYSSMAVLRREGALMLSSVVVLAIVLADGRMSRLEGLLLLGGMALSLGLLIRWSADHGPSELLAVDEVEDLVGGDRKPAVEIVIGLLALVATVYGANVLLDGALDLGERLGLSATFLGVMLGVGTSLPEMATALAAARRSAPDLVVGNVLGSNLFNSLAVAGTAGVVGPAVLTDVGAFELWFMIGAAILAGIFARTGTLVRSEALALLAGFTVFTVVSY